MSSAVGAYSGSITFGSTNESNLQAASIVAVQTDTDPNEIGLAFFTQHSSAGSTDLVESMRIKNDGNVGIGTTSPGQKLQVSGGNVIINGGSSNNLYLSLTSNYLYGDVNGVVIAGADDNFRIKTDGSERVRVIANGNVGIGTTAPVYKLDVNGGVQAGGVVTYSKVAGSLSTTGYAIAGLTAGFNGASAGFEFKCYGGNSKYQRVVYSCHCSGTTWFPGKVIDEGTNELDVVASANGATITFTFKARSSSQAFSPRVVIQATGHSINSTYA